MTTAANRIRRTDWLRAHQPRPGARLTLVCCPHAGGTANYYRSWASRIAPDVELLVTQYPGREDRTREPLVNNLHTLADRLAADVLTAVDGPVALLGHSMGALVAYETAVRLREWGREPTHLCVSGQPGPGRRRPTALRTAPDETLLADLTALGGTNEALRRYPELLELILPILRNDYHAVETYTPTATVLDCPVSAAHGVDDTHVAGIGVGHWREHTSGDFAAREFPGHHFYVQDQRDDLLGWISHRVGSGTAAGA